MVSLESKVLLAREDPLEEMVPLDFLDIRAHLAKLETL